jgi:hypothetical protein
MLLFPTAIRKNPFSTLDFIPLEGYPSSSDQDHHDHDDDDDDKSGTEKRKEKKDDSTDVVAGGTNTCTSLAMDEDRTSCHKYGNIDSDSADSDIELLANYGLKKKSKKRKCEDDDVKKRNINEILGPQKQKNPKKKVRTEDDFDKDDFENEMALMELSGMPSKRCKGESKPKEKSTESRHRRISSSDESEENNDEYEKCFICFEKIAKDDFKDHTETCLEGRGESFVTPGKVTGE